MRVGLGPQALLDRVGLNADHPALIERRESIVARYRRAAQALLC
jgi:hypothetical protein